MARRKRPFTLQRCYQTGHTALGRTGLCVRRRIPDQRWALSAHDQRARSWLNRSGLRKLSFRTRSELLEVVHALSASQPLPEPSKEELAAEKIRVRWANGKVGTSDGLYRFERDGQHMWFAISTQTGRIAAQYCRTIRDLLITLARVDYCRRWEKEREAERRAQDQRPSRQDPQD